MYIVEVLSGSTTINSVVCDSYTYSFTNSGQKIFTLKDGNLNHLIIVPEEYSVFVKQNDEGEPDENIG